MDARPLTRAGRELRAGSCDGIGLHMQGALVSMERLAQDDKYLEKNDVLDFMEITKGVTLRTRTELLKWASRAAYFKAQLPRGASGADVGGFKFRFRFQKKALGHFWSLVFETETDTETDVHFFWLLVADARTLNTHLEKVQAPISQYTSELTIDLGEWDVEPSKVTVAFDNPLFLWLRLLPVPAPRSAGESDAEYLARLGPCPVDVRAGVLD